MKNTGGIACWSRNRHTARTRMTLFLLLTTSFVLAVLAIAGSAWVQRSISQYAIQDYTYALRDAVGDMESDIAAYRTFAQQLGNASWVKKIAYMQGDTIDSERVTNYDLQEYRQQIYFHAMSTRTYEMGLIFPRKNLVIGSSAKCDMDYFINNYIRIEGMGKEEWLKTCESATQNGMVSLGDVTVWNFLAQSRAMLMVFPVMPAEAPRAVSMFVVMQHRDLLPYFEPLIRRGNLHVAISVAGTQEAFLSLGDVVEGDSASVEMDSDVVGLHFILTVPRVIVTADVVAVRNALLSAVVLLWFISMGMNMAVVRHVFKPLRQILNQIEGETSLLRDLDEFDFLQRGIEKLKQREEKLQAELAMRSVYLRNAKLEQLLGGFQIDKSEEVRLADFAKELERFSSYRVCLVFWRDGMATEAIPTAQMLEEILEQNCPSDGICGAYVLRRLKHHILIVGYGEEAVFDMLVTALLERWEMCFVAIGCAVQTSLQIRESYESAQEAKDYRCVAQGFRVLRHDNVQRSIGYYLPQEMENQMKGFVLSGQAQKADEIFQNLYRENGQERKTTEKGVRNFMVNVAFSIMKLAPEEAPIAMPVLEEDDLDAMRESVAEYIRRIAELYAQRLKQLPTRMENILAYVNANLVDSTLSLDLVAGHFNVSASLISRLFTEQYGENFHTYVNRQRIGRAMEYLADAQEDIGAIALRVGYTNDATFRRLFKRFAGITPSAYRLHMHQN